MISIDIKVNLKGIIEFNEKFNKLKHNMVSDGLKLGEACYKYIKTVIPISSLTHPHLRDSFKVASGIGVGLDVILIGLYTNVEYAPYIDAGASVPTRFPKTRFAMRFESGTGDVVFTKSAKGFKYEGVGYIDKGENWMVLNADRYIDFTLRRYLK